MGRMEEGENMDVGDQILELREQTQMTLEELALGVCTPESLRNIELGKETVSKLFMEIMYQRLGKSTDKLELIVSKEVYEEEEQWEQFEEYLERGDNTRRGKHYKNTYHHSKLTPEDVHLICKLITYNWTTKEILEYFDISDATISQIRKKNAWTWISDLYF